MSTPSPPPSVPTEVERADSATTLSQQPASELASSSASGLILPQPSGLVPIGQTDQSLVVSPVSRNGSIAIIVTSGLLIVIGVVALTYGFLSTQRVDEDAGRIGNEQQVTPVDLATADLIVASASNPSRSGPIQPRAVTAGATLEPSTDSDGRTMTFEVSNVADGDPSTAWRVAGDGIGQQIIIDFGPVHDVTRIGMVPGYVKIDPTDGTDLFVEDRRIAVVRYMFSDGTIVDQSLLDEPMMQSVEVASTSNWVTVEIVATTDSGGGDVAAIGEIEITGSRR